MITFDKNGGGYRWSVRMRAAGLIAVTMAAANLLPDEAMAYQDNDRELTSDDFDLIDPNLDSPKPKSGADNSFDLSFARLQILLDREGFSPGAINGKRSAYFDRIVELYEARYGLKNLTSDAARVETMLAESGEAFVSYRLTSEDVAGPFLAGLPNRIQDQADFKRMEYLRVEEKIAERFHMDEAFLKALNPEADFSKPGTLLKVANVGDRLDRWVSRVHADKVLRQVTAYDQNGRILAIYPASIGSIQTPSPEGRFRVRNKAGFPAYTLAPNNGFEPVDNGRQVVVAPGPNNPVGVAWIGLSKRTYGIHGTPEPSDIGNAESHGCIRLTNWDAMELTRLVRTGVEVVID